MSVYVYVRVYVCVYVYMYVYVWMYVCACVYVCIFTYMCACTCMMVHFKYYAKSCPKHIYGMVVYLLRETWVITFDGHLSPYLTHQRVGPTICTVKVLHAKIAISHKFFLCGILCCCYFFHFSLFT